MNLADDLNKSVNHSRKKGIGYSIKTLFPNDILLETEKIKRNIDMINKGRRKFFLVDILFLKIKKNIAIRFSINGARD